MKVSRRNFAKGSAVVMGGLAASHYLGGLELLVPRDANAATPGEEWVNTTCWIGKQDCGVRARLINGSLRLRNSKSSAKLFRNHHLREGISI